MAGPLAPTLGGNIRTEEAIAEPSALSGIASLASLIPAAPKPSSDASVKFDRDRGLLGTYLTELDTAAQLREQGNSSGADNAERRAGLKFSLAGGDLADTGVQAAVTNLTGRPATSVGFSDEELAVREIESSPEYAQAISVSVARHPEGSSEEHKARAHTQLQAKAINEQTIIETQAVWNTSLGQESRIKRIETWRLENQGVITLLGQQGASINREQVKTALLEFGNLRSSVNASRPAGLDPSEWKPIEDQLNSVQTQLELALRFTGTEEVKATHVLAFVQGLEESYKQGNITEAGFHAAVSAFTARPDIMSQLNAKEMTDIMKSSILTDVRDNPSKVEAGGDGNFTPEQQEAAKTTDPEASFKRASDLMRLGTLNSVDTDENTFAAYTDGLSSLFATAEDHGGWITGEGYRGLFNDTFSQYMDKLQTADPAQHKALLGQSVSAIREHRAAIRADIGTRTGSDILTYSTSTNSISFNREVFVNNPQIPPQDKQEFLDRLDFYGGDLERMLRTEAVGRIGALVASEMNDSQVLDRIDALNQLDVIESRLTKNLTGGDGDSEVGGSAGADTFGAPTVFDMPDEVREDTDFLQAVSNSANRLGFDPSDLLRVIQFETAGTFSPSIKAETSSATGLIQFLKSTAEGIGTSTKELAGMTRAQQMHFVEKYLEPKLRGIANPNFGDLYMAVHWPRGVGKDNSYTLYSKGSPEYKANSGLDINKDGTVTRGEAVGRAFGRTGNVVIPTPGPSGSVEVSDRPLSRPEGLVTSTAPTTSQRPQERPVQEGQEAPSSEAPREVVKRSPEEAQQVWSVLSAQTQATLARLFGNSEGALEAIKNGLDQEDIDIIERGAKQ